MEFADWLFEEIDIRYGDGIAQAPPGTVSSHSHCNHT